MYVGLISNNLFCGFAQEFFSCSPPWATSHWHHASLLHIKRTVCDRMYFLEARLHVAWQPMHAAQAVCLPLCVENFTDCDGGKTQKWEIKIQTQTKLVQERVPQAKTQKTQGALHDSTNYCVLKVRVRWLLSMKMTSNYFSHDDAFKLVGVRLLDSMDMKKEGVMTLRSDHAVKEPILITLFCKFLASWALADV